MMSTEDDVVLDFGEEEFDRNRILKHPVAVGFHLLFRVGALLAYLLCGWFSDSFITNFVVIILLLSMDFWTVKNISGRLLVGLRWWNYIDEEGHSKWMFESRKNRKGTVTALESRIFWLSLVLCQILWIVFLFGTIFTFKFKWLMVAVIGVIMNGSNLLGYIRCKWGTKQKMTTIARSFLTTQALKSMFSSRKTEEGQSTT
ncbi:Golgi apparatus membrane protein TVP23 B [Mactra antiquata]